MHRQLGAGDADKGRHLSIRVPGKVVASPQGVWLG